MRIRSRLGDAIARWYNGTYILYVSQRDFRVLQRGGYYRRHWTARRARSIVRFHILYGGTFWAIVIAVLFTYIAVRAFQ